MLPAFSPSSLVHSTLAGAARFIYRRQPDSRLGDVEHTEVCLEWHCLFVNRFAIALRHSWHSLRERRSACGQRKYSRRCRDHVAACLGLFIPEHIYPL